MKTSLLHTVHQNQFWLSPERCIYWEDQKTLIVADLHFGKAGHFRKSGIGIPQNVFREDLQRLFHLIQFYKPVKVIIVGDLFHSRENREMDFFLKWRQDFASLEIILVKGNHDILDQQWYHAAGILVKDSVLHYPGFSFIHDPAEIKQTNPDTPGNYFFSGHLHPGVTVKSAGKQALSFPCFYFGKDYAVLPAFGKFTGTSKIKQKKGESIYAIVAQTIISLS